MKEYDATYRKIGACVPKKPGDLAITKCVVRAVALDNMKMKEVRKSAKDGTPSGYKLVKIVRVAPKAKKTKS